MQWYNKQEVIDKLKADGCDYSDSYIGFRVGFVRDVLQYNKHYIFGEAGRILYSEAGYKVMKERFIGKEKKP